MRRPGAAHSVAWKHYKREIQLGSRSVSRKGLIIVQIFNILLGPHRPRAHNLPEALSFLVKIWFQNRRMKWRTFRQRSSSPHSGGLKATRNTSPSSVNSRVMFPPDHACLFGEFKLAFEQDQPSFDIRVPSSEDTLKNSS
ncbi:hypothetical protein T265_06348 [Opisthorchis viverrini]|uniref:Homeobox domain-containing protein n=1 Tax=Opisthorchis viverrini TaxID=6198 RepID=A0A074ZSS8_OPIVI|nr:hypothetical protein T265_06348 [Opisthorchis viverrini]KER26435.1 hypothetical protein T265_06348 [Opisthorchis viverrini]